MDWLLKLNDQLMNAPAGVVVALFAIAIGYILKSVQIYPNRFIPLVIVMFTAIAFPVVQYCADKMAETPHAGLKIPFNVLLGFIIGFLAWLFHAQILKRFVDPKFLKGGDTQFIPKPPDKPPGGN